MKVDIKEKIRRASILLFLRRHKYPGVRDWELKKFIGDRYEEIIKILNDMIKDLGFTVKRVEYNGGIYYAIVLARPVSHVELRTYGWRIDEMAILAVTISYILSRGGSANKRDIEELLEEKIPRWRVERALERFIRMGYINSENGLLKIGVRSYMEFDMEKLIKLIIGTRETSDTSQEDTSSPHQ